MAGSSSGSGATVTVRTSASKEIFLYPTLVGGTYAHPFHPGPADQIDVDRGISKNSTFDTSTAHREEFHLAFDLKQTHPAGAQAWGRMHKSGDFKNAVRHASDLARCFGAMAEAPYGYHKFGTTMKGGDDANFNQAPVVACVSRIRSLDDPSLVVGVGLHLYIHLERGDVKDADIEAEKALFDLRPDAPNSRRPPPSKLQKWADKIAERDKQRIPVKALDAFLTRNTVPAVKGGGFHAASRSVAAATDRTAASVQAAMLDHPDRVSRTRYTAAARSLMANFAEEKEPTFNELCNLPLEDGRCLVAPKLVFSLEEFKRSVLRMNGVVEWSQDETVIDGASAEFQSFIDNWRDHNDADAAPPDSFARRHWAAMDGAGTPIFPFKGRDTWRIAPEHFFPGRFELCYFPWVPRLACSEETGEFKTAVATFYPSVCITMNVDPILVPNHEDAMLVCKQRAHELLDPKQVSSAGVDDLETARAECHRIMADAEVLAHREIESAAVKMSAADEFKVQARHRKAAQINAVRRLASCLHQDADVPDAVVALVKWADDWRVRRKNFSLPSRKISKNLTWWGEMLAYWNASHEAFFNEFTQHKGATIADFALLSMYLMRKMNLLPVYYGTQGSGKSFMMTCGEARWILNTWVKFQERSDASHRIASNKGSHLMMEMTEELDPSDVGAVGTAGMSKAMQDTAQTKRACSIRDQETSQQRVFEHKDRKDGVGPWEVYSVKMRAQVGKLACTNMTPSMIPANSADRKCFVHVVKRDKKDETLKDKTIKQMPEHLIAAKQGYIDFSNRNQFGVFCVGQLFDFNIIRNVDETVGNEMLVGMLRDAGDAGVQKTDSIRDMERVKLVAATSCVLDKLTQLLDLPFNAEPEAEMTIEQLLLRLLDIEPLLVVNEEHMATAWSLLDVQYEDPLLKPIIDGILRWQKNEKHSPVMDAQGNPYKIFEADATIDISGTREQRAVRQQRIQQQAERVANKRKLKAVASAKTPEEKAALLADMEVFEDFYDDASAARDLQMQRRGAADAGGGKKKQKGQDKNSGPGDDPQQLVLNGKGVDELASEEFVQFIWEEKDPMGRARRLADCIYNCIPGKTKPSLEAVVDSCFNLMRMVILLPGGIHALAVNVTRDGNGICRMRIARVLFETNVTHKTRCFLEQVLLRAHIPRQTFVFCYPYHDHPHIWHTWYNDSHKDWIKNADDHKLWYRKHEKEILQRRRDEDIIQASKLIGAYREQYAGAIQIAKRAWRSKETFVDPVMAACKHGAKAPWLDEDDENFNDHLHNLWLIAMNETSDKALWRNNSFIDGNTRFIASKYAPSAQQEGERSVALAGGIATVVKESSYLLITEPPGELALAERLFAARWDATRLRDLVRPTAAETKWLSSGAAEEKKRAAFDAFRLELARVWINPSLCQHMFNNLYDRAKLKLYPLEFDILKDSYDAAQRREAKAPDDRLRRSTSLRMHGLYSIMDPDTAERMPLAETFKDHENVYHRSVEAKRVSGRKEEGLPLPITNRVVALPKDLLLGANHRNMFDLLNNWKKGKFHVSEAEARAGIAPPRPQRPEGKEAKRTPSPSPARGRGSKRKSPASDVKDNSRGGKRARPDSECKESKSHRRKDSDDDDDDDDAGARGNGAARSGPASARALFKGSLHSSGSSSSSSRGGKEAKEVKGSSSSSSVSMELDEGADGDKENEPPPPSPARAAPAAPAASSQGVAKATSTNALTQLVRNQQRAAEARSEQARLADLARRAKQKENAADAAALDRVHRMAAQVDLEDGEAEADLGPMDDREDHEIEEDAAESKDVIVKASHLGKKHLLQRIGAGALTRDADDGLSAKQRAAVSALFDSAAGEDSGSEDDSGKKKKKKRSNKKRQIVEQSDDEKDRSESESEPDGDAADEDGDTEMAAAASPEKPKSRKQLRKEKLGPESYAEYKRLRKEKKAAAAAAAVEAQDGAGSGSGVPDKSGTVSMEADS